MPNRFELTLHLEDRLVHSEDLYARLELINSEPAQLTARVAVESPSRWQRWGHALFRYFLGSKEPRIVTKTDREGNSCYEVYDPIDRRHYTFGSEHDVRVWLEERYYQ